MQTGLEDLQYSINCDKNVSVHRDDRHCDFTTCDGHGFD